MPVPAGLPAPRPAPARRAADSRRARHREWSREWRRTRGGRRAGPRSPGSVGPTPPAPPPAPAPLTRTLQVVASLHDWSLPAPASSLRRGCWVSARRGAATGARRRQGFRRHRPAPPACGREPRVRRAQAPQRRRLPRCPRLPVGGAGAGRASLQRRRGWRSASGIGRGPATPHRPCVTARRVCEAALTWQWLRGGRSARPSVTPLSPPPPPRESRSGVRKSGRRPRLPVASAPRRPTSAGPIRGPQALAGSAGSRAAGSSPSGPAAVGPDPAATCPAAGHPRCPQSAWCLGPVVVCGESSQVGNSSDKGCL